MVFNNNFIIFNNHYQIEISLGFGSNVFKSDWIHGGIVFLTLDRERTWMAL